jgi:hypothetical protein
MDRLTYIAATDYSFQSGIHGILATRMILHLREGARVQLVEPDENFRMGQRSRPWGFNNDTLSGFKAAEREELC